jgi:hypothetical protein
VGDEGDVVLAEGVVELREGQVGGYLPELGQEGGGDGRGGRRRGRREESVGERIEGDDALEALRLGDNWQVGNLGMRLQQGQSVTERRCGRENVGRGKAEVGNRVLPVVLVGGRLHVAHINAPPRVQEFGHVVPHAIREHHHDTLALLGLLGHLESCVEGGTAAAADKKSLFADEAASKEEGLLVLGLDPLIDK